MPSWPIFSGSLLLNSATFAVLAFPLAASVWLGHVVNQCKTSQERTKWVGYTQLVSPLMILAVPAWWSLSTVNLGSANSLGVSFAVPMDLLIMVPLSVSMLIARLVLYRANAFVFGKRWTKLDICKLAFWRTASSTSALLMAAVGMEDIYKRNILGFAWMLVAGVVTFLGRIQLRAAEGLVPRPVKSGELYKRSLVLSKKMGVRLKRVCVVPFGRGHLTNAYGGLTQIAVTDDYGHWLHGSQLDFVVGHELAHLKHKDALRTLAIGAVMFVAAAAAILAIPPPSMTWRISLDFAAILIPLVVFYALSRRNEYRADRLSVEATGEPEMAIRALASLYSRAEVPTEPGKFAELFSSHRGFGHG